MKKLFVLLTFAALFVIAEDTIAQNQIFNYQDGRYHRAIFAVSTGLMTRWYPTDASVPPENWSITVCQRGSDGSQLVQAKTVDANITAYLTYDSAVVAFYPKFDGDVFVMKYYRVYPDFQEKETFIPIPLEPIYGCSDDFDYEVIISEHTLEWGCIGDEKYDSIAIDRFDGSTAFRNEKPVAYYDHNTGLVSLQIDW